MKKKNKVKVYIGNVIVVVFLRNLIDCSPIQFSQDIDSVEKKIGLKINIFCPFVQTSIVIQGKKEKNVYLVSYTYYKYI